jgi:hypothetical protein
MLAQGSSELGRNGSQEHTQYMLNTAGDETATGKRFSNAPAVGHDRHSPAPPTSESVQVGRRQV